MKKLLNFKIVDIFIGIITVIYVICIMRSRSHDLNESSKYRDILIILIVGFIVNSIKALRLYIALFGENIKSYTYIKVFLKTSSVNIVLPYKSGEIYRIFSVGNLINSYSNGFTIVILDRFIDTLGLTTVALFQIILGFSGNASLKTYVWLAIFLGVVITTYCLFVPFYNYWNRFLILHKSSERTLIGLKILNACNKAYKNVNKIIRGRFIILYLLSFIAWGIETWSIHGFFEYSNFDLSIYLSNILTSQANNYYCMYILCSFSMFCIVGIIMIILEKRKGVKYGN